MLLAGIIIEGDLPNQVAVPLPSGNVPMSRVCLFKALHFLMYCMQ